MNNLEIVTSDMTQEFIQALIRREAAQARMAEAKNEMEEYVYDSSPSPEEICYRFYNARAEYEKADKAVMDIAKKITNCDL